MRKLCNWRRDAQWWVGVGAMVLVLGNAGCGGTGSSASSNASSPSGSSSRSLSHSGAPSGTTMHSSGPSAVPESAWERFFRGLMQAPLDLSLTVRENGITLSLDAPDAVPGQPCQLRIYFNAQRSTTSCGCHHMTLSHSIDSVRQALAPECLQFIPSDYSASSPEIFSDMVIQQFIGSYKYIEDEGMMTLLKFENGEMPSLDFRVR